MGMVKIPGQLSPNGLFPVVDGNDIKGGFYIVDTIADRDAIGTANRKIGMPCYVIDTNMYYRLRNGITNDCWDDWDLDNNGIIINLGGQAVKRDIVIDVDHTHDNIHCTVLKDDEGNKFHTETNTDLVLGPRNQNLTELLTYMLDKIEDTNDMPIESVKLKTNFLIVNQQESMRIAIDVLPKENTEKIIWTSSDSNIVTIDQTGLLTAKTPGTAYIKASSNKTRISDICSIIVSRENSQSKEITDGVICDLNMGSIKDLNRWEDSSGNFNNAELIGFTEKTEGGFKDDHLYLDGSQYIKLPTEVMNDDISTIEIVADLLFDKDNNKVVKLFAKKNDFKDMAYQINSEFISCGANGTIKEYEKLNHIRDCVVYTFVINKISKEILIYINGRLYDAIKFKDDERFGESTISPLLIASDGIGQSNSEMKITRVKVFNRGLESEEVLSDAEFLTGFYDGTDNNDKYCCSSGRWSNTNPCFSIEDEYYRKSYKFTRVNPVKRYRITLINSNYTGIANANGYNQDKTSYMDLSYLIYFNNGVADFTVPNSIYFINFYIKQQTDTKTNIYYILEEII